tara:strand:- start:1030 stop:3798 length:2769 start_codon:yes stop_codon:yes gene_type:complete
MAVQTTEEFKNGGATSYAITIEYLQESDIKVRIDGALQTYVASSPSAGEYTVSGTTVTLGAQAAAGTGNVHIYRETDVNTAAAQFAAGSSIRAADLNAIHDMGRFAAVEHRNKIITANIKAGAVTSTEILDGTIVNADINASANIDNSKIADGLLKSGITINSANIVDGSIVDADVSNSANINGSKLADSSIPVGKINSGTLPSGVKVTSTNIEDNTILNADINSSAAIAGTKISPNFGSQNIVTSGTSTTGNITVGGNITVSGTVDGRDVGVDGAKLDTIESGATADQTNAEIRAAVEAASDSNVFTDADHTKLNGIETGATADQTNAEIKTAYEANANTNEFSDAEQSKLAGIETAATADQTAGEIKTLLQSDKLTLSEMNTTSLDTRYFTETESDARYFRQDSSETIASGDTWTGSDGFVATTGAIDARIIELVDNVGGFVPIANETSFPTANPDINTSNSEKGGTIVSVKAASTNLTAQSGTTLTIANGRGTGNAVIITGVSATIPQGFGFLVETTATDHTYAFHRLVPKATEVSTVAANAVNIAAAGANVTDIANFADLYQISTSAPTARADSSSLQVGDLWFDSSSNKVLMIYDGSSGDGFTAATPNASDLVNINIVAGQLVYQEDLGLITNAVNTGSGNNSVNTVAGSISNVNTAATNIAKINTVADDLNESTSEIDTVATNITNVNNVGNNISNVNAVHNNASNINAAVSNASNINAAVSNATNINTVAGNNTNINTVAGNNSNITTVAGANSNITTVAGSIANVNTTASNIGNVNNFAATYQIASSAPSTDGAGNALAAGDLYFDTTANELRVHNGTTFQGGVTATGNLAGLGANTFTGLQTLQSGLAVTGNITVSGTVDGVDIATDSSKLSGIEAGATGDQTASEIVALIAGQTIAPNVITTTNLTLDFGTL